LIREQRENRGSRTRSTAGSLASDPPREDSL
jgi:hypothetical protein